jgi:hypothetical protein
LLADGIGCCIRMVVRRAAPSSLRMIIRSIVKAARGLDSEKLSGSGHAVRWGDLMLEPYDNMLIAGSGIKSIMQWKR